MDMQDPFFEDAGNQSERTLMQVPPFGSQEIQNFVGSKETAWELPLRTVLRASKGYGKSHLLVHRSHNHRQSHLHSRTLFYPSGKVYVEGGIDNLLVERLVDSIAGCLPSWLDAKRMADAWAIVWKICLIGHLVRLSGASTASFSESYLSAFQKMPDFEAASSSQDANRASATKQLIWYLQQLLERLSTCSREDGMVLLHRLEFKANSEWTSAVLVKLRELGYEFVAMYLDNPDELLNSREHPNAWIMLQQGLLLALWKLQKGGPLSDMLRIYVSVRSEAFLGGPAGTNVQQAENLILDIDYTLEHLKQMLMERIKLLPRAKLAQPELLDRDPLTAFTNFSTIVHEDRNFLQESAWDGIVRHTRHIPRELMFVARQINKIDSHLRDQSTVRNAVNIAAGKNFKAAIHDSVVGWTSDVVRFTAQLPREVLPGAATRASSTTNARDGISPLDVLVRHGFLGYSDVAQNQHSKCYLQRFAYCGGVSPSAMQRDFFFVHPSVKEWIDGQTEHRLDMPKLERMTDNVVADGRIYETEKAPFVLTIREKRLVLIAWGEEVVAPNSGNAHAPLKFLWLLMYVARINGSRTVTFSELGQFAIRISKKVGLQRNELFQHFPDTISEREKGTYQNWGRKANQFFKQRRFVGEKGPVEMRIAESVGGLPHANLNHIEIRDIVIDPMVMVEAPKQPHS